MAVISKGVVGLLGEIVSLLHGAVASGLKLVNNLVSSGFKMAFQFNESAMAFSRQAGLTAKQAQAYTEVLTTRAKELGEKYGIAAEEVTKLERNLAKATGRVIMLSNAQADMQVALNRTVGEDTANQFSEVMMRTMGAQLTTVQGAVSKAYATAAKRGLDAAGMAAKVAQSLSMANKFNFRNGVDGITRMVALSEKLGVNFKSMEGTAENFYDLQNAIENSAKLTMLGGAVGALGGNPLDMTYEANNDMEAFTERIAKMVSGYATFDAETGVSKIDPLAMNMLREAGKVLNRSTEEMVGMAKKQAEITYKNNIFGEDLDRLTNGDKEKRDFFLNRTQYNPSKNSLEMTDRAGNAHDINYFIENDQGIKELGEMMRIQNMSDEEIIREQATSVISIKDILTGYITSIQGIMADKISPYMDNIRKFLGDVYRMIVPHIGQIADNIKGLIEWMLDPENIKSIKEGINTVTDAVMTIAKFITSDWKYLLGALLLPPILSIGAWLGKMYNIFRTSNMFGGPSAGARGGGLWNTMSSRYAAARRSGMGTWGARGAALAQGWKSSPALRAGVIGLAGAAVAYGGSALKGTANEEGVKKGNTEDKWKSIGGNALENAGYGAMIGGMIGSVVPVLGTTVGAAVGGAIGGVYGAFTQWSENEEKQREYRQNRVNEAIARAINTDNSNTLKIEGIDGPHDLGVSTPAAGGANSAINNEFRDKFENIIMSGTHPGEMFVNEEQQKEFVKAIPTVGGREYIYIPQSNVNPVGDHKLTVNDINVKLNGTFRVEGGSSFKDYNFDELINSRAFERAFKEMLSKPEMIAAIQREWSLSTNMKPNMDVSSYGGYQAATIYGRATNS